MTIIYTFVDPRGVEHDITQSDIEHSFRVLRHAGYDFVKANDLSLDYIIAKLTIRAVSLDDLVYSSHAYVNESKLCGEVATSMAMRQFKKPTGISHEQ